MEFALSMDMVDEEESHNVVEYGEIFAWNAVGRIISIVCVRGFSWSSGIMLPVKCNFLLGNWRIASLVSCIQVVCYVVGRCQKNIMYSTYVTSTYDVWMLESIPFSNPTKCSHHVLYVYRRIEMNLGRFRRSLRFQ